MSNAKEHMLFGKGQMPKSEDSVHPPSKSINNLSNELLQLVNKLGKKAAPESIEQAILALCRWKAMTAEDLAQILRRDKNRLTRIFLTPICGEKIIIIQIS